jgi:hypothetical protein
MITTRKIETPDLDWITKIVQKHHSFPVAEPRINLGSIVVEDEEGIIGAGYLRPITEAIMFLDLDRSLRSKAEALTLMIQQGVKDASAFGLSEIHAFVENPRFCKELQKHYGFVEPEGKALVLRI